MNVKNDSSQRLLQDDIDARQAENVLHDPITIPLLYRVAPFAEKHPNVISQSGIRNLINESKPHLNAAGEVVTNGFDQVVVRQGRKILIDESAFFRWLLGEGKAPSVNNRQIDQTTAKSKRKLLRGRR